MRVDKFLKVSRIIKRRTVAKEVCDQNRVEVNGKPVKAGHEVKVGDRIAIAFPQSTRVVEIVEIREHASAELAASLYREV